MVNEMIITSANRKIGAFRIIVLMDWSVTSAAPLIDDVIQYMPSFHQDFLSYFHMQQKKRNETCMIKPVILCYDYTMKELKNQ